MGRTFESSRAGHLLDSIDSELSKDNAVLAYWLCPSLPSSSKEFDSPTPLHLYMLLASKEIQEHRLELCKACEHIKALTRCSKCGCYMPAKVKWIGSMCPIGKWGVVVEEQNNDGQ